MRTTIIMYTLMAYAKLMSATIIVNVEEKNNKHHDHAMDSQLLPEFC
jgi:hypothetical protein